MTEEILGIIEKTKMKSGIWNLYLTNNRIIVAFLTGTRRWDLTQRLAIRFGAKELVEMYEDNTITSSGIVLMNLSSDQIISSHKHNFFLPTSAIQTIEICKPGLFLSKAMIKIFTIDKHYNFELMENDDFDEYFELIKMLFPDRYTLN